MVLKTKDTDHKIISILKVLSDCQMRPLVSRVIAKRLADHGIDLGERAVRYHLKNTDERGLTQLIGNRDGRLITEKGLREINSALVGNHANFAISRIAGLVFRTNYDYRKHHGEIPVNVTLFAKDRFYEALHIMKPIFEHGFCVSNLVLVVDGGQRIGEILVPTGSVGLATVCSIIINGALLKAGIPTNSKFGGILQLRNRKPLRFIEIVQYDSSSLDPSEIFIKANMTSVTQAVMTGNGGILANFREIPAACRPIVEQVVAGLKKDGLNGLFLMGNTSEDVCEIPVNLNKVGMVLIGGLNPVAAVKEAGINVENRSMSTVIPYEEMIEFSNLLDGRYE